MALSTSWQPPEHALPDQAIAGFVRCVAEILSD
jgi:hypothetical protein